MHPVLRPLASFRFLLDLALLSDSVYIGLIFTLVVTFKAFHAPADPKEIDLTLPVLHLTFRQPCCDI